MYRTEKLPVWSAGMLAAAISASPVFAEEHGFVEDSTLTLNTRQWYSHEIGSKAVHFRAQTNDGPRAVRDRTAWVQGFKLDYISGFTQGPLGFGLDVSTYSAVALERSQLTTAGGSNRVLVDKDGNVVDDWSKIGVAALKVKLAQTTLKVGRQQMSRTPVMGYADTRTLPASFDGVSLESRDIDGLTIKSGFFDRASPRTGAGTQDLTPTYTYRHVTGDFIAYGGADFVTQSGWRTSAYLSRFDDIWDREYFGLGKKYQWGLISTDMQLDVYNTQSSGAEKGGYIDQQAYGLSVAPTWKNHTLKFGLQKIDGDEFFDFVGESNAINLPNVALSNYNGPNEKSYQINYMTDFAAYGVPGLKTSVWYIKGWGIDATHYNGGSNGMYADFKKQDDENEYEVGTLASYTLQSGNFKGASVMSGYVWHRSSPLQLENNIEEFRLIINVPFKIL